MRVVGQPEVATIDHATLTAGVSTPERSQECVGWMRWADVLIDFRTKAARENPLPEVFPHVEQRRWVGVDGWKMSGHLVLPEFKTAYGSAPHSADATSLLRIQDPDGFTVVIAVSNDKPSVRRHEFARGRFATLLPALKSYLLDWQPSHRGGLYSRPRPVAGMAFVPQWEPSKGLGVDMEAMLAAVREPHRWLGLDTGARVESVWHRGPFHEVSALRTLLEYSLAGAASYSEVAHLVAGGLNAHETHAWRAMSSPEHAAVSAIPEQYRTVQSWDDTTIIDWFAAVGGGPKNQKFATSSRLAGLSPTQAVAWRGLLTEKAFVHRLQVLSLDRAGWTPEDAFAVWRALHVEARLPGTTYWTMAWQGTLVDEVGLSEVGAWTVVDAETALAHIRAGLTPSVTLSMRERDEMPTPEALTVMAGLRHGLAPTG